jgi:hypothetical protein
MLLTYFLDFDIIIIYRVTVVKKMLDLIVWFDFFNHKFIFDVARKAVVCYNKIAN